MYTYTNKQKENLADQILNNKNRNFFTVMDLEAGTGKTLQAEKSLAQSDSKSIFIRERINDCIESANRINQLMGKTIAIAINSETVNAKEWQKLKNHIKQFQIIIITHEKYKMLSVSQNERNIFLEDRSILVIDEFLNMTKGNILSISKMWIEEFETLLLYRTLRNLFANTVKEIEDYLMQTDKVHSFFNAKENIDKQVDELKRLAKVNLEPTYCREHGYTKNQIIEMIDNLKQFHQQTCVVENKIMYCTNRKYQYWLLDNNIVLDASARLNVAYKLSPLFHIEHQNRVLDHQKWFFSIYMTNSTKSAKSKSDNYYDVVNKIISKMDNPLVVGSKEESKHYHSNNINWFGNLTGSNQYRTIKDCIISHTPNIPYRVYVLEYLYFSNKRLDNRKMWGGVNNGSKDERVYRFKDKEFEEYRTSANASEIYQAIKRVNRDMSQQSNIILFNNDIQIINKVLEMFVGVKKDNITFHDNIVKTLKKQTFQLEKHNQNQKDNSYGMKFIRMMQEIQQGNHTELINNGIIKKSEVCKLLGLNGKKFSNKIGNNIDVIDFCNTNNIIIKGQGINVGEALML